ncbi:MAG: phosphoglycerate kinase [Phycisphaerae bacterium]|nr:phosphoglycerate kinase [Phycisphaerae bacterium]|tara:strand:+ start:155 stop:1363 length:1209 start_codon:yes stop_codon:yes gene_type:complete
MTKQSLHDLAVAEKRVFMRVDFNVPLDEDGGVLDDRRIRMALPSIEHVLKHGGRLVLASHLGRPSGKGFEPAFSLRPAADCLRSLLGKKHPVHFVEDCVGGKVEQSVDSLAGGEVLVLENLRFHPGEKSNDPEFADSLSRLADVYVNDAFGTAHRSHASMVGMPEKMLDRPRVAGLLLMKELDYLSTAIEEAESPFYAVLGGAKVSDKLGAINHLLERVDAIFVGGAMAYTFLKATDHAVGTSLVEDDMIDTARSLLQKAEAKGKAIHLPMDHQCSGSIEDVQHVRACEIGIPPDLMGLDIGPETGMDWKKRLSKAKTIVWNGPMGVFEKPPFDAGSRQVAEGIAQATKHHGTTVVGGGETAAALETFGLSERISHVSTGGGASLKMLEGITFKSVDLLDDA